MKSFDLIVGLCPECSHKLNYHSKKREVKRMKKQAKHSKHSKHTHEHEDDAPNSSASTSHVKTEAVSPTEDRMDTSEEDGAASSKGNEAAHHQLEQIFWTKSTNEEEKTREEEFDEYLADLLL